MPGRPPLGFLSGVILSLGTIILFVGMIYYYSELLLLHSIFSPMESKATSLLRNISAANCNNGTQEEKAFEHGNGDLQRAEKCTEKQRDKIQAQLALKSGSVGVEGCYDSSSWLGSFFTEETDIGSESFIGISVGCNRGDDAIQTARMGMMDDEFDAVTYTKALGSLPAHVACRNPPEKQANISYPKRLGEMHCIEPMPSTFKAIERATTEMSLDRKKFVVTHAAISTASGFVKFPDAKAGEETLGIGNCEDGKFNCVDVPMYSLDSYADQFVQGKGPINVLQIDVEGYDFNVMFGASSVLDRTLYLEFEHSGAGTWGSLHVQDAVKLLDGKGFTCYWASDNYLWRITQCYFDLYDSWKEWSNVVCVHRSNTKLLERMENNFLKTLADPTLEEKAKFCKMCKGPWGRCVARLTYLIQKYGNTNATQVKLEIMERGYCINPT
eukprot:CAMPEP_0183710500 /NCGR_PEP_ID=MMETSP0737-20130205/6213_1 /TAXON_ID=385413 /ORGANISM="Thalassiosira miniscula, Strain CCMP1093" /LENGTH=440 /DNA_ID=CAMNT_0025938787 /DNA_START=54 /DNA_END=1376 /DNA_ORIENTATION=+